MPITHVSLISKPTAGTDLMGTGEELGYIKKIMVKNQANTGHDMLPSLGKIMNTQVQEPSLRSKKYSSLNFIRGEKTSVLQGSRRDWQQDV